MSSVAALGDPTDVFVVLRHEDQRWMGRLLAPRASGPPRVAFNRAVGPLQLPLGTFLSAGLAKRSMGRPAQCRCRLTGVELRDEVLAVEIELDDPTIWAQVMPDSYHRAGDRRKWPRLGPEMGGDVRIALRADAGPRSGRVFSGTLDDASRGGVGVRLPVQAEPRLCTASRFLVTLQAPDGPEYRLCTVRHRRLLPVGVRYGLEFEGDPIAAPQTYEPVWTCASCHAAPLLGETHAHCPACGAERATHTTFPDWDDLVTLEDHVYTGVERVCLRCGSGWGEQARNCGHCGTRLPVHGG